MSLIKRFKYWLCRRLCKDLLFNSDMSLEVDRLMQENDQLKEGRNER